MFLLVDESYIIVLKSRFFLKCQVVHVGFRNPQRVWLYECPGSFLPLQPRWGVESDGGTRHWGDGNCFALETGISTVVFQQHKSRKGGDFKVVSTTISDVDVQSTTLWSLNYFLTLIDWVDLKLVGLTTNQSTRPIKLPWPPHRAICWPKVWQSMTLVNYSSLRQLELSEWKPGYRYIEVLHISISTDVRQSIEKPSERL